MEISERLTTAKSVAQALDGEDWSIIDMTLEAFGCPTDDVWSGTKPDYVIAMIREVDDAVLHELANHLGVGDHDNGGGEDDPDCWDDGYFRLFLSHLAAHKAFAHDLKAELAQRAISGFVAHDDITPTAEWIGEIERALFSADALVALMHRGFENSFWTDQEVGAVMGRRKPILAVKLETHPHGFLGKYQAIPGGEASAVAKRLFEILANRKDTAKAIAYAVVYRTEHGIGHNDNQYNFGLLEQITYFDQVLADRLTEAMDQSNYVSRAYNKVSVMTKLFSKWGFELEYEE